MANYVYTQQEINIAIGNDPPQRYMEDVRKQCNGGELAYGCINALEDMRNNLAENAVPFGLLEASLFEYEDFLTERRKAIAARLEDYYFSL